MPHLCFAGTMASPLGGRPREADLHEGPDPPAWDLANPHRPIHLGAYTLPAWKGPASEGLWCRDGADRAEQIDYPAFLAQRYQVGSGLAGYPRVGVACKRFGTDRIKGAGMRWSLPGAQQVATYRMFLLPHCWQEAADHCRMVA